MTEPKPPDLGAFREHAAAWLSTNVPAQWWEHRGTLSDAEDFRLRHEWERQLFRGGYAGLSLPTEYGGQGLGLAEEVAFHELAARAHAPGGVGRVGKMLAAPTLIACGTDDQKAAFLPLILAGEQIWCQGFSEPAAGSDLASVETVARRVDGGYLVRGRKTWTSFSRHAHRCLLLAKTDATAPRHRNLSVLLLDMNQPGVVLSPIRQLSGGTDFSETILEDVFVAEADRLGDHNDGWRVAMTVLSNERGAIEAISRYVDIRADIDLLQRCCAATSDLSTLDARAEVMRWQVNKAVGFHPDTAEHARAAGVLKIWWSELWQDITSLAVRTSCPVHRARWRHQYLESRSATIYSGTSEIQRNIIAERILGLPK